jgi:hypothetical protein
VLIGCALILFGVAVLFGLHDWRRMVFALLLFLPFAGIPTILLYPAPAATRVLKDVYLIVPAYLGFWAWAMQRGGVLRCMPSLPSLGAALGLFSLVVVAQVFNPNAGSLAAGAIGVKTWLFYMPLLVLGHNLVDTTDDVQRLFRWMLAIAVLPIAGGIVQALLISAGRVDLAYLPYGDAAVAVSQGFSATTFHSGSSMKAPSVFTFITQYYNFLLVAIALSFALGLGSQGRLGRGGLYYGFAAVATVAAFLSGSRGAFFTVPLLLGIATVLSGKAAVAVQTAALTAGGLVLAGLAFGTSLSAIWEVSSGLLSDYLFVSPISEFREAATLGYWGVGTGYNTGPARLADAGFDVTISVENYLAKAMVEVGVVGLVILLAAMALLLIHAVATLRRTPDRRARMYGVGIVALLIVSMVNFWKGSYLDVDPLNVYFWLLAGVLFRLPAMQAPVQAAPIGAGRWSPRPRRPAYVEGAYARSA